MKTRTLVIGGAVLVVGAGVIVGVGEALNERSVERQLAAKPELAKENGKITTTVGDTFLIDKAWPSNSPTDKVCVAGRFLGDSDAARKTICAIPKTTKKPSAPSAG